MKFNICGFTHKGTGTYVSNEDNMLLNGAQLNGGDLFLEDQDNCICFVSDGVGGSNAGDFASAFVLARINELANKQYREMENLLYQVNEDLLKISASDISLNGCACTLSGLIAKDDSVDFIHVGDSEIWLFRNDMFFKVTQDEVVDPDDWKSPLTNYFGGNKNILKIKTGWFTSEFLSKDIYLICTDGVFKSLNIKLVKSIIASEKTIREKVLKLKENCIATGSDDNVTAIMVEVISNEISLPNNQL